ncbi:fatty acid desaturase [Pelagibius sp.]|uniref:fatty acid desaturase n=1 Tax=Pelagibius sp. TaxID=1931238 RepID=UPI00262D179F|nr:fatty acid desaturase [Pelagibius sp.]
MEEEVYRNSGIDKRELKALSRRSDAKGLLQLARHLGLLSVTGAAVLLAGHPLVYAAALLGHGIALAFLFAPLHETIHRTAFESRWLNDGLARICGLVLLLPPSYFRLFHFQHHRFTQDPERDPELARPAIDSLRAYLLHVSGLPYWRERIGTLLKHALGRVDEGFIPARQRREIANEARAYLAVYCLLAGASLAAGSMLLLALWVLPLLLGQPALRLFLMAEHGGCPRSADMLVNSRTTHTLRPLQWLSWNMNRHSAHHAYPAVPFHALPDADGMLAGQTVFRSEGYIEVHRALLAALWRRNAEQPAAF